MSSHPRIPGLPLTIYSPAEMGLCLLPCQDACACCAYTEPVDEPETIGQCSEHLFAKSRSPRKPSTSFGLLFITEFNII